MNEIRIVLYCEILVTLMITSVGCVSMPSAVGTTTSHLPASDFASAAAGSLSPELAAMEQLVRNFSSAVTLLSEKRFLSQPREKVEAYLSPAYREQLMREQQAAAQRSDQLNLPGMSGATDLSVYDSEIIPIGATQAEVDFAVGNRAVPGTGYHILVRFKRVYGNWRIDRIEDLGNG